MQNILQRVIVIEYVLPLLQREEETHKMEDKEGQETYVSLYGSPAADTDNGR